MGKVLLEALFEECVGLADKGRPGYMKSLGSPVPSWADAFGMESIPPLLRVIFGRVRGTPRQLAEQKFLDFVPGDRIPSILEYSKSRLGLANVLQGQVSASVFPLLENYSSDYYYLQRANEDADWQIWLAIHDSDSPTLVFSSEERFLTFVRDCYASGAYSTDNDGYLDCDFDKQDLVGRMVDPSVAYWHQ